MTDYEYITHGDNKIQVESAVRDALGYRIDTAYPKKVDIRAKPGTAKTLVIAHGLQNAPSAVSLYVVHHTTPESLEKIEADIMVTNATITITFIELPTAPDAQDLELLVRSLI
jgi:hypothetical protein